GPGGRPPGPGAQLGRVRRPDGHLLGAVARGGVRRRGGIDARGAPLARGLSDARMRPGDMEGDMEGLEDSSNGAVDTAELCIRAEALAPLLYPDLKRAAHGVRAKVSYNSTLQTTALINEAYLKLARGGNWQSRRHFLTAAAVAMRHVLVDRARARLRLRRGEGVAHIPL